MRMAIRASRRPGSDHANCFMCLGCQLATGFIAPSLVAFAAPIRAVAHGAGIGWCKSVFIACAPGLMQAVRPLYLLKR